MMHTRQSHPCLLRQEAAAAVYMQSSTSLCIGSGSAAPVAVERPRFTRRVVVRQLTNKMSHVTCRVCNEIRRIGRWRTPLSSHICARQLFASATRTLHFRSFEVIGIQRPEHLTADFLAWVHRAWLTNIVQMKAGVSERRRIDLRSIQRRMALDMRCLRCY
jgi:hypothetical protein